MPGFGGAVPPVPAGESLPKGSHQASTEPHSPLPPAPAGESTLLGSLSPSKG